MKTKRKNQTPARKLKKNSKRPSVIVLRTAGTNCDQETAFAFSSMGARVDRVHINRLFKEPGLLAAYQILAIPGGFSYGDDIMSGKILANELRLRLGPQILKFIQDGKLIIGICNGFQVLVRAGLLPGPLSPANDWTNLPEQSVTLINNDSGKFEDRWVNLRLKGRSVWTEGLGEQITLPVAHAEGKFLAQNEAVLNELKNSGRIIFSYCNSEGGEPRYPENPNGSQGNIAGITDVTGRVLGLMPHPERHFLSIQHPCWTKLAKRDKYGDGMRLFENGVNYARNNL